jgi:hypothetical protein
MIEGYNIGARSRRKVAADSHRRLALDGLPRTWWAGGLGHGHSVGGQRRTVAVAQRRRHPTFRHAATGAETAQSAQSAQDAQDEPARIACSARLYPSAPCNPAAPGPAMTTSPASPAGFYDRLAPFYHLFFPDWDASIQRQGEQLGALIEAQWPGCHRVLDVSCGATCCSRSGTSRAITAL